MIILEVAQAGAGVNPKADAEADLPVAGPFARPAFREDDRASTILPTAR